MISTDSIGYSPDVFDRLCLDLQHRFSRLRNSCANNVSVFGAGRFSGQLIEKVSSLGGQVSVFYDNDQAKWGQHIDGIHVCSPVEMTSGVLDILVLAQRFPEISACIDAKCPGANVFYLDPWMSAFDVALIGDRDIGQLHALFQSLQDLESKKVLASIMASRVYGVVPIKSEYAQYFHPQVQPLAGDVFIDGGAYIGDTVTSIAKHSVDEIWIHSFEPDQANYSRLSALNVAEGIHLQTHNFGVWSSTTSLLFRSSELIAGFGCSIDDAGDVEIQVVDLDSFTDDRGIVPSMIKLDVEGAEFEAILGARKILERVKPKLAVSLYHKYSDLWRLPTLIHEINPDYKFYLGHHRNDWLETVLYAC